MDVRERYGICGSTRRDCLTVVFRAHTQERREIELDSWRLLGQF